MFRYFFFPLLLFPVWLVAQMPPDMPKTPSAVGPVVQPKPVSASITAEQWASPRRGSTIVKFPGLAAVVEAVGSEPDSWLAVHHAPGDESQLWAEEMRAWLVALGLPSSQLRLVSDLPQADALLIELRKDPVR